MDKKVLKAFKTLVRGSLIANIITIVVSPLMTRLYSAEDIGFYMLLLNSITLFGPIVCLKYEMHIVRTKELLSETNTVILCIILGIFGSIFFSAIYTFYLASNFNIDYFRYYILIFFLLMMTGLNNILLNVNNKYKEYSVISKVTVTKTAINNLFMIILGVLKFSLGGLLIAQILSLFGGVWKQSLIIRKNGLYFKSGNLESIKRIFKNNLEYLVYSSPSALISTFIYSSIILFIGFLYSKQEVGYYSLGFRVLGIPFTIISANIAKIYYERISSEFLNEGTFYNTLIRFVKMLTFIIVPLIIILAIFAPLLFEEIFGEGWGQAGIFIVILAPLFAVRLITDSVSTSFIILGKQKIEFFLQLLFLTISISIYILAFVFNLDIIKFLITLSISYTLIYVLYLTVIIKYSKLPNNKKL